MSDSARHSCFSLKPDKERRFRAGKPEAKLRRSALRQRLRAIQRSWSRSGGACTSRELTAGQRGRRKGAETATTPARGGAVGQAESAPAFASIYVYMNNRRARSITAEGASSPESDRTGRSRVRRLGPQRRASGECSERAISIHLPDCSCLFLCFDSFPPTPPQIHLHFAYSFLNPMGYPVDGRIYKASTVRPRVRHVRTGISVRLAGREDFPGQRRKRQAQGARGFSP